MAKSTKLSRKKRSDTLVQAIVLLVSIILSGFAAADDLDRGRYVESDDWLVQNPDRGFYRQIGSRNQMVFPHEIHKFNKVYRIYFPLAGFENKPLDNQILSDLEVLLVEAEKQNVTVIPRFYYTWGYEKGKPFSSPDEDVILGHVVQISSILNQHKNAISFVEAGFIGAWGEWHSDQYGSQNRFKPFRRKLVAQMLESFDEQIFLALRYPADHQKIGNSKAFDSRVGLHHDCPNYKSDTYPSANAHKLTKFLPQGGEVCQSDPRGQFGASKDKDKYYGCEVMLTYFDKFNFDVLNGSDWSGSNSRFREQGCFDEISKRLGYRFVLKGSKFQDGKLSLEIHNVGFGKSFKSRWVKIRDRERLIDTQLNARDWYSGGVFLETIDIGETDADFVEIVIEDGVVFANETENKVFLR